MIELFEQPHSEARRLVATGAPVFLTVNPVEYHGPHLSLHNDRLVSRGLVRDLHAQLAARHPDWPLLVGADLEIGVDACVGPGSRHIRYQAARELVLEACRAIAELGARRVVIMTFHGGPLHSHALQAGIDWLTRRGVRALAPFNAVLRKLILAEDLGEFADGLVPIADRRDRELIEAELRHDFHGGFFETSMTLHYAPASVASDYRTLPPCPPVTPDRRLRMAQQAAQLVGRTVLARELEFAAWGVGWAESGVCPGYTSRPNLASAASGAVFARHMLAGLEPVMSGVLEGHDAPPAPIMPWIVPLSAGGRLTPSGADQGRLTGAA